MYSRIKRGNYSIVKINFNEMLRQAQHDINFLSSITCSGSMVVISADIRHPFFFENSANIMMNYGL